MDISTGKHRILPDESFHFVAPYSLDECSKRLMELDNQSKGVPGTVRYMVLGPTGAKVVVKPKCGDLCEFNITNYGHDVSASGTLGMQGEFETRVDGDTHIGYSLMGFGMFVEFVGVVFIVYELITGRNAANGLGELIPLAVILPLVLIIAYVKRMVPWKRDLKELIEITLSGKSRGVRL